MEKRLHREAVGEVKSLRWALRLVFSEGLALGGGVGEFGGFRVGVRVLQCMLIAQC